MLVVFCSARSHDDRCSGITLLLILWSHWNWTVAPTDPGVKQTHWIDWLTRSTMWSIHHSVSLDFIGDMSPSKNKRQNKKIQSTVRHKQKRKTTSLSYGRTSLKENPIRFFFINLWGKVILCYFAYADVASEDVNGVWNTHYQNLWSNLFLIFLPPHAITKIQQLIKYCTLLRPISGRFMRAPPRFTPCKSAFDDYTAAPPPNPTFPSFHLSSMFCKLESMIQRSSRNLFQTFTVCGISWSVDYDVNIIRLLARVG